MIDRAALAQLPPQQRARIIYRDAQSDLATRLWRAALGDADPAMRDSPSAFRASRGDVEALLLQIEQAMADQGPDCGCPPPAPAIAPAPIPTAPISASASAAAGASAADLGANNRYRAQLCAAASRTGVPASALAAVIDAEAAKAPDGSWNPYSRNPRSSAAGIGQFLAGTWLTLAETPGTALNRTAAANGWLGSDGHVRSDARGSVLALRYDPASAIEGVADYARLNLDKLANRGVPIGGDVARVARAAWLSHHLGTGDAMKFLTSGIAPDRARMLLQAQVGGADAERRIDAAGDATRAHQRWLLSYLDRRVRPERFLAT